MSITGRCLCGAITIATTDAPGWAGACHCSMCRTVHGSVFVAFPAAEGAVSVEGSPRVYASSEYSERAFCPDCGTALWFRDRKPGADYNLMQGLFPEAASWPLRSEIYADCAMGSVRLEGDHKRATREEWHARNPHLKGVRP